MRRINVKGPTLPRIKVSYKIGNSKLKPARKLEIGQWWLYRDSKSWDWPTLPDDTDSLKDGLNHIGLKICAVLIVDLIPGGYGGEEAKVEFMVADPQYAPYAQTDTAWYMDQNFDATEGLFAPFWDANDGLVYKNTTITQYGVDCTKCKRHYPHAVRSGNFECWSCKNGY